MDNAHRMHVGLSAEENNSASTELRSPKCTGCFSIRSEDLIENPMDMDEIGKMNGMK